MFLETVFGGNLFFTVMVSGLYLFYYKISFSITLKDSKSEELFLKVYGKTNVSNFKNKTSKITCLFIKVKVFECFSEI